MKKHLLIAFFIFVSTFCKAQTVDSIYVNLYTDSLKKGTYNYINIDGLLSNGRYIPLDANDLTFESSGGTFHGNSLFVPFDFAEEKISISVILKKNKNLRKDFVMFIKQKPDGPLKTSEELIKEMESGKKKKNNQPASN